MVKDENEAKLVYGNFSKVVARFMGGISVEYAGFIPHDNLLRDSVARRKPVMCAYPEAASSDSYRTVAGYLMNRQNNRRTDGNIKFFWKRLVAGAVDVDNRIGN